MERKVYDIKFKEAVITDYFENGLGYKKLSDKYKVNKETVRAWVLKARDCIEENQNVITNHESLYEAIQKLPNPASNSIKSTTQDLDVTKKEETTVEKLPEFDFINITDEVKKENIKNDLFNFEINGFKFSGNKEVIKEIMRVIKND